MKKILTLLIAGAMLFSMCSCAVTRAPVEMEETVAQKEEKESSTGNETESIFGKEPVEAEKSYRVIAENVFAEGDIQPIRTNDVMYSFGYSEYSDGAEVYLIDYEGNKIVSLGADDSDQERNGFCDFCGEYNVGSYTIDPETAEFINNYEGHGGTGLVVFDPDTATFYDMWGDWPTEIQEWDDYNVVPVVKAVEATEEQKMYGIEHGCELTGEYVLTLANEAVERGYEYALKYDRDGIAALCKDGKWGYFNSEGEQILPCEYDASFTYTDYFIDREVSVPYSSSCGYIALEKDGMWGYADLEGNMVTDLEFEEARPVYMGKAWVKIDGEWSVISFEEYDDIITEEEAIAIAEEYGNDVTYTPDLNNKYYGTVSYGFRNVDEYGYLSDFWVLYNGDIYTSLSRNYEYNF